MRVSFRHNFQSFADEQYFPEFLSSALTQSSVSVRDPHSLFPSSSVAHVIELAILEWKLTLVVGRNRELQEGVVEVAVPSQVRTRKMPGKSLGKGRDS